MKQYIYSVVLVSILCMPLFVFGAAPGSALGTLNPASTGNIGNAPSSSGTAYSVDEFSKKFVELVNWFSWGVALIAVVMGLYAGFLYITAQGETSKLATAHKTLLWAIVGIAVAIMAFSIIGITKAVFAL